MNIIDFLEFDQMKKNVIPFKVGDTLKVHVKIVEGDKQRKNIEVMVRGHVRRAKLYYLRKLRGKAARIREKKYVPVAK